MWPNNIDIDMKGPKPLSKRITTKMSKTELTKYKKLHKEWIKTGEDMVRAQAASVKYGRALVKIKNPTAVQKKKDQKLINAGFRAEHVAFKKAYEYDAYKKRMEGKYA